METKDEIRRGIAAYQSMQDEITAAIDEHGGELTHLEFDKTFGDVDEVVQDDGTTVRVRRLPKIDIMDYDPKAYILGTLRSSTRRDRFVHLAQFMVLAGILTATPDAAKKVIVYRRAENPLDTAANDITSEVAHE